jgi:hypothetical protein
MSHLNLRIIALNRSNEGRFAFSVTYTLNARSLNMDKPYYLMTSPEVDQQAREWVEKIPDISFPEGWLVRPMPNWAGSMVRFLVTKEGLKDRVSVYLDCYERIGCYGEPYWEAYPVGDDVARCAMNDVDGLIEMIGEGLTHMEKGKENG